MPMNFTEDEFSDDDDLFLLDSIEKGQSAQTSKSLSPEKCVTTNKASMSTVTKKPTKLMQLTLDGKVLNTGNGNNTYTDENILNNPTHHQLNYDNFGTYIYPTNFEVRDYQFTIVERALFENLLCALPTGLGKTFIASTVMLNFYRWTTSGKIIFMAPTRPLVSQQIKACYGITGIPPEETAILLDKTKRNRAEIWESKRVFFATPQVVENDLTSGLLDPKEVVCLVVDEAHRAKGNYSYANVVKFIKRFSSSFRVLALSATPSSDIEGIQQIIDNLNISRIEIRTENSPDTSKYMKNKVIEKIDCESNEEISFIICLLSEAILPVLQKANSSNIYEITDPAKINHFQAMEKSQRIIKDPTLAEGIKWSYYFTLQLLGTVGQLLRRLNVYGIKTFYSYFLEKYTEFTTKYDNNKSTNKTAASFYYHPQIKRLKSHCEQLIADDEAKALRGEVIQGVFSHSKLEYLIGELTLFLDKPNSGDSKVIIFTEFRESALEIVQTVEAANAKIRSTNLNGHDHLLRPHIFIGQAKEKDKFDQAKYVKSIAPKRRGKGAKTPVEEEPKRKCGKAQERPADRVGSSEDAQSKGMSQKLQKQLIQDFKSGKFNILVATSIGEEGLDIGEVDLIVCFDSTSSPIKNIQRMGRTGRKRDGKIVLLFSSNERSKFDKAMDNYEWIQNQIQLGHQLKLKKSERIIPKQFNPHAEKIFIQIPEENAKIVEKTNDIDEFLKLATQLTSSKKSKTTKSKKGPVLKQQKIEKRFFMPDNVETGFKKASKILVEDGTDNITSEQIREKRKMSLTDTTTQIKRLKCESISDSDFDADFSLSQHVGLSSVDKRDHNTQSDKENKFNGQTLNESSNFIADVINLDDSDDDLEELVKERTLFIHNKTPKKTAGQSNTNKIVDNLKPISVGNVSLVSSDADFDDLDSDSQDEKENPPDSMISKLQGKLTATRASSKLKEIERKQSALEKKQSKLKSRKIKVAPPGLSILSQLRNRTESDSVIKNVFSESDGLLTKTQQAEFFSKYYVESGRESKFDITKCDNPLIGIERGPITGGIPHSERTYSLIDFISILDSSNKDEVGGQTLPKIDKLYDQLLAYHEENLIYQFNDEYRLRDRIADDSDIDQ